jgi:hypothetical protein
MNTVDDHATKQFYNANKDVSGSDSETDGLRRTFIMPFVVSTFLALPSLLVVAYSKQTAGFDLLKINGAFDIIMAILWVLIGISLVSCLAYLWRGYSHAARVGVVILEIVVLASFVYILWPN